MKRHYSFLILFLVTIAYANGQVYSRISSPSQFPSNFSFSKNPKIIELSDVIRKELYFQDSVESKLDYPFRFGQGFEVDIDIIKESVVYQSNENEILYYEIKCPKAYSINLIFNKITLSSGSELNIYNADRTFRYGPVTLSDIPKTNVLGTDLVQGEHLVIELTRKKGSIGDDVIRLSRIIYGYRDIVNNNAENPVNKMAKAAAALSCHNDVTCSPTWQPEADAVASLIIGFGSRLCTGSLLNTTQQNYTPYFLTAFHCIDADHNGSLTDTEKSDVSGWSFRFKYQSTTCNGPEVATSCYSNFFSSEFKAAYVQTDMALVQLTGQPRVNHGISFLGWNKSSTAATNATLIHHPDGIMKKISFDNDALTSNSSVITWTAGPNSPVNTHWIGYLDSGSMEGGSSGAPVFDQNKRVVGQLHGGDVICPPAIVKYGRFDVSWTGGGTNVLDLVTGLTQLVLVQLQQIRFTQK